MKIGVIGSGDVARTLADGFLKHGHAVTIGTRSPDALGGWAGDRAGLTVGSPAQAATFAEVAVLAVKGSAALAAVEGAGPENLGGKPVIDATNPLSEQTPPQDGVIAFFTGPNESLMEQLQTRFPDARFVKAFNSVGAARMVDPVYAEGRPTMFICGDDGGARTTVAGLVEDFGWEVADMGVARAARAIEPLCMLWCIPGFRDNRWTHAFKMLRE